MAQYDETAPFDQMAQYDQMVQYDKWLHFISYFGGFTSIPTAL